MYRWNFNCETGSLSAHEYDYQQRSENRSPWTDSGEFDLRIHATRPPAVAYPNEHYWHFNQVPPTGDFAPFPLDPTRQHRNQQNAPTLTYATQSVDPAWRQPVRSVPYEHMARGMPSGDATYAGGYRPSPGHEFPPFESRDLQEGQDIRPQYGSVGQQQHPFLGATHSFNSPGEMHPAYTDYWSSHAQPYEPARREGTGTPSEDFTQQQPQ